MLLFKRFIVWVILFGVTLTHVLLYIPDFTCMSSNRLSICLPQFSFGIIDSSSITHDFIASLREFLKLLSYLTIDMGWSNGIPHSQTYNDENLVNTFSLSNDYNVNHFGYCKLTDDIKEYCTGNNHSGLDIFGLLVKDVGIQLAKLSSRHENNTNLLGDSLVFTYHLSLSSVFKFLKGDERHGNSFSKLLIGDKASAEKEDDDEKTYAYRRGVFLMYGIMLFNRIFYYIHLFEIMTGIFCLIAVITFGFVLLLRKKHNIVPQIIKISSSLLLILASTCFIGTLSYITLLKMFELDPTGLVTTGWEMLEVSLGSGFIVSSIRYIFQWIYVPLAFITSNHYTSQKRGESTSNFNLKSLI